jgi:two-component system, OmpR family, sensor kinase
MSSGRRRNSLPRRIGQRISAGFDALPIRTRLAAVSALLTFAILCAFAVVVGFLIAHRMRTDFSHDVAQTGAQVALETHVYVNPVTGQVLKIGPPSLRELAAPEHAVIKLYAEASTAPFEEWPHGAASLGPIPPGGVAFFDGGYELASTVGGYQVETLANVLRNPGDEAVGRIFVQYGRPLSEVQASIARIELFLLLGVLAGTGLALIVGTMIARRAMSPIAALTGAAEQIARTRDSSLHMPEPKADDEVALLARTLGGMLKELDTAHAETEGMLRRQRQFVADASHELRTPLTSVLANLELLAETLHGEQGEAARSALRSSQRMRRLVADLLLLARSDTGREVERRPTDLAQVAIDAAAELGPMSVTHELSLDAKPAVVEGSRDELERVAINLIENALRHTPPGTRIWVSTDSSDGYATLVVEDNGPGVPPELAGSLFERFVRGAGDRGGSFGLGLAIVRAVAQAHGGSVSFERTTRDGAHGGARFVVRLPASVRSDAFRAGVGDGQAPSRPADAIPPRAPAVGGTPGSASR